MFLYWEKIVCFHFKFYQFNPKSSEFNPKAVNLNLKRELEKYLMDCKVNIISNVRLTTEPF